jgi:hypothetical protein
MGSLSIYNCFEELKELEASFLDSKRREKSSSPLDPEELTRVAREMGSLLLVLDRSVLIHPRWGWLACKVHPDHHQLPGRILPIGSLSPSAGEEGLTAKTSSRVSILW